MTAARRDRFARRDLDAPGVHWSRPCHIAFTGNDVVVRLRPSRHLDGDDRQVLVFVEAVDLEPHIGAAARAQSLARFGWIPRSRLDPGFLVCRLAPEIDLDRHGATERRVWAPRVVPVGCPSPGTFSGRKCGGPRTFCRRKR